MISKAQVTRRNGWTDESLSKLRQTRQARMATEPLTEPQQRAYDAIKALPGLRIQEYAVLVFSKPPFRYRNAHTMSACTAAIKGLISRGLVHYYAACHCGWSLKKKGRCYKCAACGSIYADVYVTFNRIGLV